MNEEEDDDSDAAIADLLPSAVVHSTQRPTGLARASSLHFDNIINNDDHDDEILSDPESPPTRLQPSKPKFNLKRAASATTFRSHTSSAAPTMSRTNSPHLLRRPLRRASGLAVTQNDELATARTAATVSEAAAAAAAREFAEWDDGSPPPRISRSLSLSQASGTGWNGNGSGANNGNSNGGGGGNGCAKVTRTSLRRRSRANSTSSPLAVLEATGSTGEPGSAGSGSCGSGTSRSVGSGGASGGTGAGGLGLGARHKHRRRRSMFKSLEGLHGRMWGEMNTVASSSSAGAAAAAAVTARSHNLPFSGRSNSSSGKRPTSLPKGLSFAGIGRDQGVEGLDPVVGAGSLGGDPGVGWVLRAPTAPFGRHRSHSFASGGQDFPQHARSASVSGLSMRPATAGSLLSHAALDRELFQGGFGLGLLGGGHAEEDAGDIRGLEGIGGGTEAPRVAQERTPQSSPSRSGSAARQRSNNLSSVARRMDRLEIRSPDVDTHAAQVMIRAFFCLFASLSCVFLLE